MSLFNIKMYQELGFSLGYDGFLRQNQLGIQKSRKNS